MGEEIASTINQFFHLLQASVSFQNSNDMHIESMLFLGFLCIDFDGEQRRWKSLRNAKARENNSLEMNKNQENKMGRKWTCFASYLYEADVPHG